MALADEIRAHADKIAQARAIAADARDSLKALASQHRGEASRLILAAHAVASLADACDRCGIEVQHTADIVAARAKLARLCPECRGNKILDAMPGSGLQGSAHSTYRCPTCAGTGWVGEGV